MGNENAQHVFLWARNTFELVQDMKAAKSLPLEMQRFAVQKVSKAARDAHWQMSRAGEEVKDYTAQDLLQAAILMLEWDGES